MHIIFFIYEINVENVSNKIYKTFIVIFQAKSRELSMRTVHSISLNTLRPRPNGRHFPDIFRWVFLNENVWIWIKISSQFVPRGPINNIPALIQIMAWRRPGDKPFSEPMVLSLVTHICASRPQWVKTCIRFCCAVFCCVFITILGDH